METAREVRPRVYGRLAVTLLLSSAVIRVESRRSIEVDRGSVLLLPPGQLCGFRPAADTLRAATLLLGPSEPGQEGLSRPALVTNPELGARLDALLAELRLPIWSGERVTAIRSAVARLLRERVPLPPAARSRGIGLAPVHAYLKSRLGETVPTATLATLAGLTESHLIRAFHLEFGLPPHAYHLRLRLAAASELLAQGLSVSAVTYECGFADQSHLSRKFKEVYGLTPAAWAAAAAGTDHQRRAPARQRRTEGGWRMPIAGTTRATGPAPFNRPSWPANVASLRGALVG